MRLAVKFLAAESQFQCYFKYVINIKSKSTSQKLKESLVTGLLVLAPIGAVVWILAGFWNFLLGLTNIIPESLHPKTLFNLHNSITIGFFDFVITILMFFILLCVVITIGFLSRNVLGKQFLSVIRSAVSHVPVLNTVYSTLEQLLQTFTASGGSKSFSRVVMIEYPRKGIQTLALVTGEKDKDHITVYVPTTPNPTSGFYLIVKNEEAQEMKMSVEDALKEIISMGLVRGKD